MSIKFVPEAYERYCVYQVKDATAFDLMREQLAVIDEDRCCGTSVKRFLSAPPEMLPPGRRIIQHLCEVLGRLVRDDLLPADARFNCQPLKYRNKQPHRVLVIHCPRDLFGASANATILVIGVLLRQGGDLR